MVHENSSNGNTREAAKQLFDRGFSPIPFDRGRKGPGGTGSSGWPNKTYTLEDFDPAGNIGIHHVGDLAASDLDCSEARKIAGRFLEPTITSGRESAPDAHWWCELTGDYKPVYKKFTDTDGTTLLELRFGKGKQTVVPPSVHPGGEHYVTRDNGLGIARVDGAEYERQMRHLAVATLIARHLPPAKDHRSGDGGGRHGIALHLTGYLMRDNRVSEDDALQIALAGWDAAGYGGDRRAQEEAHKDIRAAVRRAGERIRAEKRTTGGRELGKVMPGVPEKIADYLGWDDPGGDTAGGGLPLIQVNGRHLRDVTTEALTALEASNDPPHMFVRGGRLVQVMCDEEGTPEIRRMDFDHVRGRLARAANFARIVEGDDGKKRTPVNPPEAVVKDLMALGEWDLPPLAAIVGTPILRPDGTLTTTPGYDPATRLYYQPTPGFEPPEISAEPDARAIKDAVAVVDEAVGEFPYTDRASIANTMALLLTPLVRAAIKGPVPLALIDKPNPGTGGSLLAEAAAFIGTGRPAEMLGAPKDDEEWRKQITAKLIAGAPMITIDNVEGSLFAPSLARALTSRQWTDRVLGRSETITVPQRAAWIATGNNITLRGDLPRRCYWIRLDAKNSRPWERKGFKHPDLLAWIERNRARLVGALLTIARAWFAAGNPKPENAPHLGGFESWVHTVGGMIALAGFTDFLGNLNDLYSKADEGTAEWEGFLAAWFEHVEAESVTVAELTKEIKADDEFRQSLPGDLLEALDKSDASFTRRLGRALSKRSGTRHGERQLYVESVGELRRAKMWSVSEGSESCEFVSFVSFSPPSEVLKNETFEEDIEKTPRGGAEKNSNNSQTHTPDGPHETTTEDELRTHPTDRRRLEGDEVEKFKRYKATMTDEEARARVLAERDGVKV